MAFMRMGSFEARPGMADELIKTYQQKAIPVIRAAAGNITAFLLQQHTERNHFLACTVWKTKEDAENYDKSGQAMQVVNTIRHYFNGAPELVTYEVYGENTA